MDPGHRAPPERQTELSLSTPRPHSVARRTRGPASRRQRWSLNCKSASITSTSDEPSIGLPPDEVRAKPIRSLSCGSIFELRPDHNIDGARLVRRDRPPLRWLRTRAVASAVTAPSHFVHPEIVESTAEMERGLGRLPTVTRSAAANASAEPWDGSRELLEVLTEEFRRVRPEVSYAGSSFEALYRSI